MASFKRLSETELSRLGDEALVDYVAAAREAGDEEAAKTGAGVLAFGSSISGALLALDDAGFGDLSAGVWTAAIVLGVGGFMGIVGWQRAPATVSTSVH